MSPHKDRLRAQNNSSSNNKFRSSINTNTSMDSHILSRDLVLQQDITPNGNRDPFRPISCKQR